MIALPIIPNPHTDVRAYFVLRSVDGTTDRHFSTPVTAWDSAGYALIPGSRGRLTRVTTPEQAESQEGATVEFEYLING